VRDPAHTPARSSLSTASCAACSASIREPYYFAINGKSFCAQCHDRLRASQGTPASRFFAALGWGGGAALVGAAIYYGIRAATGYELGLVAIVVGVLVGKGVVRGARGLGGGGYQFMAILLTYFAIVLTYVPEMVRIWSEQTAHDPSGIGRFITAFMMIGLTLFSPVVVGVQAPLSLVITAIALYEAWKITRQGRLVITGPHALAAAPATVAAAAVATEVATEATPSGAAVPDVAPDGG